MTEGAPTPLAGTNGYFEVEFLPVLPTFQRALLVGDGAPFTVLNPNQVNFAEGGVGQARAYDPYHLWDGTSTLTPALPGTWIINTTCSTTEPTNGVQTGLLFFHAGLTAPQSAKNNATTGTTTDPLLTTSALLTVAASNPVTVQFNFGSFGAIVPDYSYFEVEQLPGTPAFAVCIIYFGGLGNTSPGSPPWDVVPFTLVSPMIAYDPLNMFNGNTQITVPVDGYYRILCRIFVEGGSNATSTWTITANNPIFPGGTSNIVLAAAEDFISIGGITRATTTLSVLVHVPATTNFQISFLNNAFGAFLQEGYFEIRQIGT